ncbi:hypothetical protein G6F66_014693 [Rhizopus arrhizus]|nr:hypothetical protein G6F66_014693 [Rhizopus arrhizus]
MSILNVLLTRDHLVVAADTLAEDALTGAYSAGAKLLLIPQHNVRPELARADLGAAAPEVIAGQVDVLPAQRRQIDRVPQHYGRRHQVEAADPVALLLDTAVADFAPPGEEPGAG